MNEKQEKEWNKRKEILKKDVMGWLEEYFGECYNYYDGRELEENDRDKFWEDIVIYFNENFKMMKEDGELKKGWDE